MKDWKCKECGNDTFEEVMQGVVQTSVINNIEKESDGALIFDYSNISTDGGEIDTIHYECCKCGYTLPYTEIEALVE